jgi:hypothetical protein
VQHQQLLLQAAKSPNLSQLQLLGLLMQHLLVSLLRSRMQMRRRERIRRTRG